jgi:hypothetical protein
MSPAMPTAQRMVGALHDLHLARLVSEHHNTCRLQPSLLAVTPKQIDMAPPMSPELQQLVLQPSDWTCTGEVCRVVLNTRVLP